MPLDGINQHWSLIKNALHSGGILVCEITCCFMKLLIYVDPLHLPDANRFSRAGDEHHGARLTKRRELNARLRNNHEIWGTEQVPEVEYAATVKNSHKLFDIIQVINREELRLGGTTREVEASSIDIQL